MPLLLRSVEIIDPDSPAHNEQRDMLIDNGVVKKIDPKIEPKKSWETHNIKGGCVSPGWLDMYAGLRDPGLEHKEDIRTGTEAAAAGGFTGVVCSPDTEPALHSKSEIEYVQKQSREMLVDVYPLGAVTRERSGKGLTEMYDMWEAGAVAFTDGNRPIHHTGTMLRALQYVKYFNGQVFNFPDDDTLAGEGLINEGAVSTKLGVSGRPALAEELGVMRDIRLAKYTDSRVHFTCISTKGAVNQVRRAKEEGLAVTAGVPPYQLILDDTSVQRFDSYYKTYPPLRTPEDIEALKEGVKEGVIDVFCSHHQPEDEESKQVEFDQAAFGVINLETAVPLANTYLRDTLSLEQIVTKVAVTPYQLLDIQKPVVQEGKEANFTLFHPEKTWRYEEGRIRSKSKNSPFIGHELTGEVIGVVNNGEWQFFQS